MPSARQLLVMPNGPLSITIVVIESNTALVMHDVILR